MKRVGRVSALALVAAFLSVIIVAQTVFASYHYSDVVYADLAQWYVPIDESSGTTATARAGANITGCTAGMLHSGGFVAGGTGRLQGLGTPAYAGCHASTSGLPTAQTSWSIESWINYQGGGGCCRDFWSIQGTSGGSTWQENLETDGSDIWDHVYPFGFGPETTTHCGLTTGDHMVDVVHAAGTIVVYLDGVSCGTTGSAATSTATAWCDFGFGRRSADFCGGGSDRTLRSGEAVGQFAWYGYALTSTQVTTHHNAASSSAGPPHTLIINPPASVLVNGHTELVTLQSLDDEGRDATSSSTYTFGGTSPSGGMTCVLATGQTSKFACTATAPGLYSFTFTDTTHSLTATGHIIVSGTPSSFFVSPSNVNIAAGQSQTFRNKVCDPSGLCVSAVDAWNFDTVPSGVTCAQPVQEVNDIAVTCRSDVVGSYLLIAHNAEGIEADVAINVAAAATASTTSCHSGDLVNDTVCYLSNLWNTLVGLPGEIANAIYSFLFVSATGKSYIDTSGLTATALIPTVDCRSGQTPTAADGVHCMPFPFSLPFDASTTLGLLDVSPTAPAYTLSWDFHYLGATIHAGPSVTVADILTTTTMTYIRGAELIIFIIGTALGTWRILQMVGVG